MAASSQDIIFPALSIICVFLNIFSLVILFRSKDLRQKRFTRLLVFLSISDALLGFEYFLHTIKLENVTSNETIQAYICVTLTNMTVSTLLSSVYQVLLICIERLNATFEKSNTKLKLLTSDLAVGIGFIVLHVYPISFRAIQFTHGSVYCDIASTVFDLAVLDIPAIIFVMVTVVLYVVVIIRIKRQHCKIHGVTQRNGNSNNTPQSSQSANAYHRVKRNLVTLSIVISLSSIVLAPRPVASMISFIAGNTPETVRVLLVTTWILILHPLLNPVIYVLRLKQFRKSLRCCSGCKQTERPHPSGQAISSDKEFPGSTQSRVSMKQSGLKKDLVNVGNASTDKSTVIETSTSNA